ncbi:ABC transporter permease, partial [Escherichia coli]
VIPLIFSFATSFRSQTEIVSTGFRLLPVNWILDNYVAILTNTSTAPIMQWLWNSMFIAVTHTVLVVIVVS